MNKIILTFLLLHTFICAKINIIVSIPPEKTFVKAIGGDMVTVTSMVLPGDSPHTYEPKPSQMISISKANIYFSVGVEFEHVWLAKFKDLNAGMHIVDITKGIKKMSISKTQKTHHLHQKNTKDPHLWVSPNNVKKMGKNIYEALTRYDRENTSYYMRRYEEFIGAIEDTDMQIKKIFSKLGSQRKFMVFHPSWGYFANAYNLEQVTVEIEGKSPKPKTLIALIQKAKKDKIKAIFTQPEFSDNSAKIIANELHIPVIKVSPLNPLWSENLISMARNIVGDK